MRIRDVLCASICCVAVSGCVPQFTPPTATKKSDDMTVVVKGDYKEVWQVLIDYVGGTYFMIDNVQKDSGIISLTFGASDEERFIDCGKVKFHNMAYDLDGPFVTEVKKGPSTRRLEGKTNIIVREIEPGKIRVKAKSRYVYQYSEVGVPQVWTWAFDTDTTSTQAFGQSSVTCQATGAAERAIMESIKDHFNTVTD